MANHFDEPAASAAFPLRRFVLFLLASTVLHAILLVALRSSPVKQVSLVPHLEIRLVAPAERKSTAPTYLPSEQKVFAASHVSPAQASRAGTPPHASRTDSARSSDIPSSPPLPEVSLGALLDSARQIVRDDEHRHPPPRQESLIDNDRPVLPQLARALQREPAGETRFANGMMKVVTASGSVYCLRPMPGFARGGPVEPTSIPTNCP